MATYIQGVVGFLITFFPQIYYRISQWKWKSVKIWQIYHQEYGASDSLPFYYFCVHIAISRPLGAYRHTSVVKYRMLHCNFHAIVSPHCNAKNRCGYLLVTDVTASSVYWMNRSKCHLGCGLGWVQEPVGGAHIPHGKRPSPGPL